MHVAVHRRNASLPLLCQILRLHELPRIRSEVSIRRLYIDDFISSRECDRSTKIDILAGSARCGSRQDFRVRAPAVQHDKNVVRHGGPPPAGMTYTNLSSVICRCDRAKVCSLLARVFSPLPHRSGERLCCEQRACFVLFGLIIAAVISLEREQIGNISMELLVHQRRLKRTRSASIVASPSRSPFSHCWCATTAGYWGIRMMRGAVAILGLLVLGGCAGDVGPSTEQPSMYLSMAESGAKLDPAAAASMISLYRQNNGLGGVVVDPGLMQLAESQSKAMAGRNKIDHDVTAPLAKRLNASGYPATVAVENVSAGYHTLAEAFSGWRDSPPHRANMLKSGVTKLGIAASYAPNTKYKVFWTLILASSEA
jgi:cysteine-rich secretory family protein